MKNWKIKIGLATLLLLNIFMIFFGLILIQFRKNALEDELIDAFTSKQFVYYATEEKTNDWNEMVEYFNLELDLESGIDNNAINRDEFSSKIVTNSIDWDDLMDLIVLFNPTGSFKPSIIENPIGIALIITLDQGGDCWKYILLPLLSELSDLLGIELSPATSTVVNSFINLTLIPLLNNLTQNEGIGVGLQDGLGIDLITFDEYFTFNEIDETGNIKTVEYDFSDGVQKNEFTGDGFEGNGIQNWNYDEITSFFSHGRINFDARGDMGWYYFSPFLYRGLGIGNNVLFMLNNFVEKRYNEYTNDGTEQIYYNNYELISDLDNTILKKTNTSINSDGETLFYSIYLDIDYATYFDKALKQDGLTNYSLLNATQINGLNKFDESSIETYPIDNILWEYGQEDVAFDEFLLIVKNFHPFLRSNNYFDFINDTSRLIVSEVKLSDLPKQYYV